jgi:hypothetical protein
MWALLTPPLAIVLEHLYEQSKPWWRAVAIYGGVGIATIVVQAIATGFALGWWWSFPSLIPTSPAWHIVHQLRSRTVVGGLVFAPCTLPLWTSHG